MTTLALSLLFFVGAVSAAVEFGYSDQTAWDNLSGSFCNGSRQSPINIVTRSTVENGNRRLTPLRLTNWDTNMNGYVLNNGHTLKFSPSSSSREARVQTFISTYKLVQFHFHWGPNDDVGSENTVNSRYYSGELHFVNQYTTAVDPSSQFTVVGVFLRADSSVQYSGTVWEKLTETIPAFNTSTSLQGIRYDSMLPSNLSYYYFPGSLTTPLCNEVVEWFVLQNPVSVPIEFFDQLRTLNDTNGDPLTLNYRNIQPLNGRTVSRYTVESVSGSIGVMSTTAALLGFLLIAVLANY